MPAQTPKLARNSAGYGNSGSNNEVSPKDSPRKKSEKYTCQRPVFEGRTIEGANLDVRRYNEDDLLGYCGQY